MPPLYKTVTMTANSRNLRPGRSSFESRYPMISVQASVTAVPIPVLSMLMNSPLM